MQTIVTDVHVVCLSISLSVMRLHCAGLFGAAFAKSIWPLVFYYFCCIIIGIHVTCKEC